MYPVQMMISYFTTSFTAIMHIGREVTAKQYTGGDLQDSKGTYIKKQAQEWVRLVSYRYKEGQCRHILSFLACLHSFVISNYWLPPVCHSVWNDRSMTMCCLRQRIYPRPVLSSDTADIPAGGMPITMESMTTVSKGLFMLPLYGNLRVCGVVNTCG